MPRIICHSTIYFNPRPPCGGRLVFHLHNQLYLYISIHVLRVEDDTSASWVIYANSSFQSTSSVWRTTTDMTVLVDWALRFQSTSSVWRTTEPQTFDFAFVEISIHVLRVEDDDDL